MVGRRLLGNVCGYWNGPRRGLGGEELLERDELGWEMATLVVDGESMVERLVDHDSGFGVAEAFGSRKDLEDDLAESGDVVVAHYTLVLEAECLLQLCGTEPGPVGTAGGRWCDGKGAIVASKKGREEGVGLLRGGDVREAELRDEAILKGAQEPFDPAFRLWEWARMS